MPPTTLQLMEGDLLEAQVDALVNAVNTDGIMGKGIALLFKQRFPAMFDDYRQACASRKLQPGRMHVFDQGDSSRPRFIINFPTKRDWRSSSRLEDIESGLFALVDEVKRRNIRSVALPALGCGNGGLEWQTVLPLIDAAFTKLEDVRVMVYPPKPTLRKH